MPKDEAQRAGVAHVLVEPLAVLSQLRLERLHWCPLFLCLRRGVEFPGDLPRLGLRIRRQHKGGWCGGRAHVRGVPCSAHICEGGGEENGAK